jgi:membrane protein YqaA with SNARE-associated domain
MKRIDWLFLVSVLVLFTYWLLIMVFSDLTGPIVGFYYWFQSLSVFIGYPGAFIVSLLGNATILVPFPYIAVIFFLGGTTGGPAGTFIFDPWILGVLSGVGATLGEMTGYVLGWYGSRYVDQDQANGFLDFVNRHPTLTPFVVWFLAATPLPDDMLVVPLGVAKYSWKNVLVPQLIGKTMFLMAIAWAGRIGLGVFQSIIVGDPKNPVSKSIEVAAFLLLILCVYVVIRFDWTKASTKTKSKVEDDTRVSQ